MAKETFSFEEAAAPAPATATKPVTFSFEDAATPPAKPAATTFSFEEAAGPFPAVVQSNATRATDAEIDSLSQAQSTQDAAAGRVTDTPQPSSVLEGRQMLEPEFNPAEGERLSRRVNAEQVDIDRAQQNSSSMLPGRPDAARPTGDGFFGRAGDLIAAETYGAASGLGRHLATAADTVGAEDLAANLNARSAAASDKRRLLGQGVELERAARQLATVEGFAPGSIVQDSKRFADNYLPKILAQSPQAPMALFGGLAPLVGMSYLSSYADARDAGKSPTEALAYAVPQAAFEYAGEKLGGMGKLSRAFENAVASGFARDAAWRDLGKAFVAAGAKEVPSEEVTFALQFINDKFSPVGLQPNAGWEDFKKGAAETAIVALGSGGMLAGAGHLISGGAGAPNTTEQQAAKIKRLREAGDTAAADLLQRRLDRQSADAELAALQLPAAQTPEFQDAYRGFRAAGMKPAEAAARTAVVTDFRAAATAAGMSEKAVAAALDAGQKKGLEELPGFLHRYTQSLASRGAAQAVDIGPQLEAALDAGLEAATESLYGDIQQTMDAAVALEGQQDGQTPAGTPAAAEPSFETGNDIAITPEAGAAHAAATSPLNDLPQPTQAQKEAGNYKVGRLRIAGMDISIENPQGSTRSGTDEDGKAWETPMRHHYGYFRGTKAADGDKLDVFVVPGTPENYRGPVFVVDQINPKTGRFDEHKVVLGARDEAEAEAIYRSNYSADWRGLGAITRLPMQIFKAWAASGKTKEALGDVQAPQQTTEDGQAAAPLPADQAATAADGTAGLEPGAVQPVGEDAGRAAAEQPAAVEPARSARQVAEDAERARIETQRAKRSAAAREAAKPMEGLSVGTMPTNAEPVTVKDGVVHIGKYPAQNFETGEDVTVPAGVTPQQIAAALREAGAMGKHARVFGLPQETLAPQSVQSEPTVAPAAPKSEPSPPPAQPITDFGEKIGGARKDVWASLRDQLGAVPDANIGVEPLSKSWPLPDYQALLDGGADPWTVAFMRAARDDIPAKPRMPGKVRRWAAEVQMLRDVTARLVDGRIDAKMARERLAEAAKSKRGLLDIAGRVELYMAVGHKQSLAGVRITAGEYTLYKGVEYKPAKVIWTVEKDTAATAFSNWPRELASGDTREQAIANFKAKYDSLEIQPKASREATFDIYGKDGKFWVGKKIGRNPALLAGPFDNVKAAREYRDGNQDALLAKLEKFKEIPNERRDTNNPRVGEDMRNGQDATPQMFADAFGFRGVEFGNWVEQGKRQKDLNDAYDALMDMAAILDVPPRALSLNGELGLAFGARGTGGKGAAAAHYERDFVAINLTKKEGAGALGHEWWHGLDNYFSRMRSQPGDYMTEGLDVSLAARGSNFIANTAVRKEMVQAFGDVVRAIKNTAIKARSSKLDAKRSKDYWTTGREMSARAFESYLIAKLQDHGASNDYLANIVDEAAWKAAESMGFELDDSYPYPTAGEIPVIREAFDKLFQTIETRETEHGIAMYARGAPVWRSALRDGIAGINAKALTSAMWQDGIKGLLNKGAVKADEVEWSGITDWLKLQTGKVTKEQVLEYLDGNGVQVEEVTLGKDNLPPMPDGWEVVRDEDGSGYLVIDDDGETRGEGATELEARRDAGDPDALADDKGQPKYEQYTLPGGENYREVLLTLPRKERPSTFAVKNRATGGTVGDFATSSEASDWMRNGPRAEEFAAGDFTVVAIAGGKAPGYTSSHWDQSNVLAHIRVNDRTDADGKRVLFVEELQSDWGQEGKKKGFKNPEPADFKVDVRLVGSWHPQFPETKDKWRVTVDGQDRGYIQAADENEARYKASANETNRRDNSGTVPPAPFVTKTDAWLNLALKRIITMAAQEGYDRVAFVNGEQSAERYDLSKQVESIDWKDLGTGGKFTTIKTMGGQYVEFKVKPDGMVVETRGSGSTQFNGQALDAVVGKDVAEKIMKADSGKLSGLDLKVGGEGMRTFYDKIVPAAVKKLLPKVGGGQMEKIAVGTKESNYKIQEDTRGKWVAYNPRDQFDFREFATEREARGFIADQSANDQPGFEITPAMREKAAQGLPMFARSSFDAEAFRRAFSAPAQMTADRARGIVEQLAASWESGPELKTVATAADLPGGKHPADARGLLQNGIAYVVAANNPTRDAVARTLAHEAIGHYGLWRMLGKDGTARFQSNVQLALASGNKPLNAIRAKVRRLYVDDSGRFNLSPAEEANEIAAFAVEEGIDPVTGEFKTGFSWLKQFWASIAGFLRDTLRLRFVRFTNTELQGMLVASMKGLQAGHRLDGGAEVLVASARQDQPVALPDIIVANNLGAATSLPDYPAAKAGDIGAAVKVARALVTDKLVAQVRAAIGDSEPVIVPVVSEEAAGRNRIPLAAAEVLADRLGLETEAGIVQANRPHRTGMDGLDRLFAVPDFTGPVEAGRDYLLLDDTLTQGATFAALASHIRQGGGRVVGAVALTGKQYSATITPSDKSLQQLREKHGDLETDFRAATGYGFDALTQSEARYLANYEPAQRLRDRIAAEGRRAREDGDQEAAGSLSRGPGAPQAPDQDTAAAPNAWSMPADTRTDRIVYELQDSRVDLKRAQQAIEAAGRDITEQWDARLAETLYPGRVAYRAKQFLEADVKPLLKSMAAANMDMDELSDYLHARGAEERNAQIAKVNPDLPDGGAGKNSKGVLMTTAAARDYLAAISPVRLKVLESLAKQVDAITAGTRGLLVAEGLEKQETIDAWEAAYKHYVPMFRDEAESGAPPHPQGTGFAVRGSASRRATGSTKQVTNMLAHVLMQREAAITRAEKNRVALSLYGLALSHPNPEFWTTIKPSMSTAKIDAELQAMGVDPATAALGMERAPTIRTVDDATGKVVDRPNPLYRSLPGAIPLKVNGEDRVLMLNTSDARGQRLAASLKNLDGLTQLDIAGSIVGRSTRWLAAVNTQYNPAFGLVNLTRDTLGGAINLGSTELRGNALKVLAQTPAAITGIAWELMTKGQNSKWGRLYRQFVADGGQTGYKEMWRDPHERARAIEKELKAEGRLTPGKAAHAILDLLDGFNTTLENAVRLSAYSAALDKGMSRAEAARLGRELTVDFNRKGRAGREIGPLYAFFNASVQGAARTIETLRGPTGANVIAGGLSLGILQALMLMAAGYDDDEIQEFVKARALIIPMPGEDKPYISIPYPLGLHVLPNTGRVLAELALNGGKDIGRRSVEAIGEIAAAFNPLGSGNVLTAHGALTTMAPTLADPLIDIAANRNFAGYPIERQPYGGELDNRPGAARAKESTRRSTTGQVYIGISEAINRLTGGSQYEAGAISPTPERIRYLAQTVGGGVLRELEKGINAGTAAARGEPVKPSQIPVTGRFYGEINDAQVQSSRYHENVKAIRRAESSLKAAVKTGDAKAVEDMLARRPEILQAETLNEIQRAISELNRLAVTTVGDYRQLEQIDAQRTELMRSLNASVKSMEKPTPADKIRSAVKPAPVATP